MVVFWVLAGMALISVLATLRIPPDAVDHDLARGMDHAPGEPHPQPSRFTVLAHNRELVIFGRRLSRSTSPTRRCCRWSASCWRCTIETKERR